MKTMKLLWAMALGTVALTACNDFLLKDGNGEGELAWAFSQACYDETKAVAEVPDTSDFILSITDEDGKSIYQGAWFSSPESKMVKAGNYSVEAVSREFSTPKFNAPQYGDSQIVKVKSGTRTTAVLNCSLMNCGVRLDVSSAFLSAYPSGVLFLKSDEGRLMYSYRESRIAYFKPGSISVVLENNGKTETLLTRSVARKEILTININVAASSSSDSSDSGSGSDSGTSSDSGSGGSGSGSSSGGSGSGSSSGSGSGGITIQVDTTHNWTYADYTIGGSGSGSSGGGSGSGGTGSGAGSSTANALSVAKAKENIGATDVWVYGFIVGGDLTSSAEGIEFAGPFDSSTNIAIASRTSVGSKESCLSVQLPKGDIRDALNLVSNPDNLGRKIFLCGDLVESYYGIPGLKNVTDYVLN